MQNLAASFLKGMLLGAVLTGLIVFVLAFVGSAHGQMVTWRLVGSTFNVGANSMTCVYEGRLSNGQTTTTTTIVPGTFCPSAPGASW